MRIIAGEAKGRTLATPASGTRPMTGRVRESVFSILQHRLVGAAVLDLYAGVGSLGLEALSRGAADAVFVERDSAAAAVILENIDRVGLGGSLRTGDVSTVVPRLDQGFDIIFVDPPYAAEDALLAEVLSSLAELLATDGVVVMHRQASSETFIPEFLTCSDERHYGDAVVTMMERQSP